MEGMKLFRGLERDGSKGMRKKGRHSMYYAVVTRSRVWQIASQKPLKSKVGGKESLLYFGCR